MQATIKYTHKCVRILKGLFVLCTYIEYLRSLDVTWLYTLLRRVGPSTSHDFKVQFYLIKATSSWLAMTSILSSFPALYSAAPRLTIRFFTCPHRIHHSISPARLHIPRTALRPFRSARYYKTTRAGLNPGGLAGVSSPLSSLSRTISANQVPALESQGKYIFPEVSHKAVAYWLLASAASVFGIVVFGGLTRLTESGYSLF